MCSWRPPVPRRQGYSYCRCRLTSNYLLKQHDLHIDYAGDSQLLRALLLSWEFSEIEVKEALADIEAQFTQRAAQLRDGVELMKQIAAQYRPKHAELWLGFRTAWLRKNFQRLVRSMRHADFGRPGACSEIAHGVSCPRDGLYLVPIFTPKFCKMLREEVANFIKSGLSKSRPNNMLKYGVVIHELGLSSLINEFTRYWIDPLAKALLPHAVDPIHGLDSQHSFTVHYSAEVPHGERSISTHVDNSEVTLNVNLGGIWCGGELLCFGADDDDTARETIEIQHAQGHGILHAGNETHSAQALTSGWRENLVILCRSSPIRRSRCPRCGNTPQLVTCDVSKDEGFMHMALSEPGHKQKRWQVKKVREACE